MIRVFAIYCLIGMVVHCPIIVANVLLSEEKWGTLVVARTLIAGALLWPWFTYQNVRSIVSSYRDPR